MDFHWKQIVRTVCVVTACFAYFSITLLSESAAAASRSNWQEREAENIAGASQYVNRKGHILELSLRDGKVFLLKDVAPQYVGTEDSPRNRDEIISFHFVEYLRDIGYYVIWEAGYEWDRYTLISDSSRKVYEIEDHPYPSPDKKRIVAVSHGMEYREGGIFIWRLENGIPTRETTISALGAKFKEWKSNDTFIVTKSLKGPITVQLSGGKWNTDKPEELSGW